jgi:hypothetical protein
VLFEQIYELMNDEWESEKHWSFFVDVVLKKSVESVLNGRKDR